MARFSGSGERNVPNWTQDANSPHNLLADGHQFILGSTYDEIQVRFSSNTGNGSFITLRLNGDSGSNYDEVSQDGTETKSKDKLRLNRGGENMSGFVEIRGRFDLAGQDCTVFNASRSADPAACAAGKNSAIGSPLTSFQFVDFDGNPVSDDIDIEVYGRSIA